MRFAAALVQDLRYALRNLRHAPGFTAVTVLTLALGIGANAIMFSIVDPIILRPLPFKDPARLVTPGEVSGRGTGAGGFSSGSLLDWRARNRTFESFSGWFNRGLNLSGGSQIPERVDGMLVNYDFFRTLGVAPSLGRDFSAADDRNGAPRVAILSHALWKRRFGGDPGIVGRSVTVDSAPCTVAGVMPASFRFFYGPEMWMPMALDAAAPNRRVYYISGVARLKPGMTAAQAEAQAGALAAGIERPGGAGKWSARVRPLGDAFVVAKEQKRLVVLFGAVGFVLLIACVNVANLLLARAASRRGELAIRLALGAGRGRLAAQLLSESLLVALAGGVLGLVVAHWGGRVAAALVSPTLLGGRPEIAVDARVLLFTLALSVLTGVVFGTLPAWRAGRVDLEDALKGARRGISGKRQGRLRAVLVAAEVGLSLVLLIGAGLTIRSLDALGRVDLGFRHDRLLTVQLSMARQRYSEPERIRAFYGEVLERVSAIPGVRSASISLGQAPWDTPTAAPFDIPGEPAAPNQFRGAAVENVTPGYFATMSIGLVSGRAITERDGPSSPPVVVVNRTLAKMHFPGGAVGRRILLGEKPIEIVGVVADVRFGGPEINPVPMLYLPMAQAPRPNGALALSTSSDPLALTQTVRAALAQIDPDTPASRIKSMERIALDSMAQPRMQTGLMVTFGALALLLAALGVYGVVSYWVAQATHDIGIRMALGAGRADILRLVMGRGLMVTAIGLAAGLAGALALTRVLGTLLFHVKPTDPLTFAAVPFILLGVALVAALIPARRALRLDPVVALRVE